ncbi:hypothetical protein JYU34_022656 [Plutella xylostella]|uniref:Hemicentin-1 n=2 Tax=Plutella xylostella TaxID=51655 RepID=A0ABQ7PRA0_PLUXY|nr:hypothetical protein JYU34_022656 [Plutella xylostella]
MAKTKVLVTGKVDAYPTPQTIWRHNNTILNQNDNIEISSDNATIFIRSVGFEDLGEYSCTMKNIYEMMVANGTLSLPDTEAPLLSKEPVERVTMKGKSALVTCRILKGKPKPKITWLYKQHTSQDFSNLTQDKAYLLREDGLQLMIKNVDNRHAGYYRCWAENYVGHDVYDSRLVVRYAPQFQLERDSKYDQPLQVRAGDKIQLSCKPTGEPRPIVTWTKEHQSVPYSSNVYLTEENDLVIDKARAHDSGSYTCTAASVLGAAKKDFTLIVYEPTVDVLEGELVELPCIVAGIPAPRVEWRQNGGLISERRKYVDDDFVLRFVANLTDFGDYTCVATNPHGNATITYNVYVWVPPYIEPPLQSSEEVLKGDNITLSCDAVGFPVPTIEWEFQGKQLTANTSDLSFNDVGSLYITNASEKHFGKYSCVAENGAGAARKTITLDILEPPSILPENFTGPYIATTMDLAVTISCRTSGHPRPFVAWTRDGRYLDIDDQYDINFDGSLTIKSPTEELSGNYTCVAKNKVGSTNKTVEVQIYPLPTMMQSDSSQSTMTVLEGSSPTLQCPVCRSERCTVKWYKDAQLISLGNLSFSNISRHNASTYACTVSNSVGSAHSTVSINVEWPPRFVALVSETVLVVRGEDSVLDCTVDAKPVGEIKWLFNSKPLPGEDKEYLKLRNVKLQHTGLYKCVVSNTHGVIARRFTVDVLVPPFISHFEVLDVTLKEGMNATLDCNAKGYPKPNVTWTYNNSHWHITNSSLQTSNASVSASGSFRCDASNMAAATHLVYKVTVVTPPRVEVRSDGVVTNVVEVELTKPTRITCHATGNPTPLIQWMQHGNIIATSVHDAVLLELDVSGVAGSRLHEYYCVASNEAGTDVGVVKVYTLEPPKISTSLYQETDLSNFTTLEVLSGSPFYLTCYGSGYPEPHMLWYKDGNPLTDKKMIWTDFGEILVSNKATFEQSGSYQCVAMNQVGEAKFEYLVDVLEPPLKPDADIPLIRVSKGQPLKLSCPAAGHPVANVTWFKRGRVLNENGGTFIINKTKTTDTGHYACILTNKVGSTEVAFNVRVEVAPSIAAATSEMAGNESSVTVKLGRSAVLRCLVDGEPKPQVVWYKNRVPLSTGTDNVQTAIDNRIVTIWRTTIEDAGLYQCVAENSAGKASWDYKVIVLVPGRWTPFSSWTLCNVSCGVGYQHRARSCVHTSEQGLSTDSRRTIDYTGIDNVGGNFVVVEEATCKGKREEERKCRMPECEDSSSARWSSWSVWSACSAACGAGTQTRARRCRGTHCVGDNVQIRKCPRLPKCPETDSPNDVLHSIAQTPPDTYSPEATYETEPYEPNFEDVETIFEQPESNLKKVFVVEGLAVKENGPCGVGFTYHEDTDSCEDIDECLLESNACHSTQACENAAGGYRCACPAGYAARGGGQRCLDINECSTGAHGCQFACVNTAGGHVCACPAHMRLRSDRRTCYTPTSYHRQVEEIDSEYAGISMDIPAKYMKQSRSVA